MAAPTLTDEPVDPQPAPGPVATRRVARGRLAAALDRRLRSDVDEPLLAGRSGRVVLDAGPHEVATVTLDRGRLTGHPGAHRSPTTLISGSADTLVAVVEGRASGVGAFLDGRVTVRGDLSLALALDGLFDEAVGGQERPQQWPRASLITARGIPTAYLESGPRDADTAVVLLHGLGATNASMLPLQWDLGTDHRVIAPDLPGFGASGKPRGRYDAAWFVDWLIDFLDALGVRSAVLVGNSMGGRISLEAGIRAPERCTGLVLLAPAPAFRRMRQWTPLVRLIRPEVAVLGVRPTHHFVVEAIRGMMSDPERLPPAWYAAAADEFLRVFGSVSGRICFLAASRQIYLERAYGERGFWQRLPALTVPSLFVWGDRDRLVPASFSRHVREALPEAGSIVLEDCGHVPQFEHPGETAAIVRGFLDAHPAGPPRP
jgi:pimeloyl-ACP methyl ester carboxylesterase/predicted lipid carrier protein YhbT